MGLTAIHADGGAAAISTEVEIEGRDRFILQLDMAEAPRGSYELELSRNGKQVEFPRYRITKVPDSLRSELSAHIDEENHLVQYGRKVFPLGIYDTSGYSNSTATWARRVDRIAEAPFDLYINYWIGRAPTRSLDALMRVLERHEMAYLHTVNRWYENDSAFGKMASCGDRSAPSLGETLYTACRVAELRGRKALAGWYTADERGADDTERVFRQFDTLKGAWAGGVSFVALNRAAELELWRDAADVFDLHRYPIFNVPEGASSPLSDVYRLTRRAKEAVEQSRPVWTVIQAFQHGRNGHFPTFAELRSMSYMAVVGGADGLFYWSYGAKGISWIKNPDEQQRHWSDIVRLTQELDGLESVILSPNAPGVLDGDPGASIAVLTKEKDGLRYVFAVNLSSSAAEASFSTSRPFASVSLAGQQGSIAKQSDRFKDTLEAYGARVYVIRDGSP